MTPLYPVASRTALQLVLLAALGFMGELVTPRPLAARPSCWETVLDDWGDGAIAGVYPIRCYRQAIQRLPADVRLYSSASEDISRALTARVLATRGPADAPQPGGASRSTSGVDSVSSSDGAGLALTPLILAGSLAASLAVLAATCLAIGHLRTRHAGRR